MKEKDALVDFDKHRLLLYVEKADGNYGAVETGSYMVKHYVDDFWEKNRDTRERAMQRLLSNESSPIGYYMAVLGMTAADVAARAGLRPRVVKKHMQPKHFGAIRLAVAARYAEVFNIPVANLFQIARPGAAACTLSATANPWIVMAGNPGEDVT
jgi:hypothetical protein